MLAEQGAVVGIYFGDHYKNLPQDLRQDSHNESPTHYDPVLLQCEKELHDYFAGKLRQFTTPIHAKGTSFREKVWEALLQIDYGETASYKDIAIKIGNPKSTRAVGGANHNNPISIIIPCHRVIGANGSLTGYGGGLDAKKWLLGLEQSTKFVS